MIFFNAITRLILVIHALSPIVAKPVAGRWIARTKLTMTERELGIDFMGAHPLYIVYEA